MRTEIENFIKEHSEAGLSDYDIGCNIAVDIICSCMYGFNKHPQILRGVIDMLQDKCKEGDV